MHFPNVWLSRSPWKLPDDVGWQRRTSITHHKLRSKFDRHCLSRLHTLTSRAHLLAFLVTDAVNNDNNIIALSKATIDSLQCFHGNTILVRGKKRKETMLIVLADEQLNEGSAKINRVVRHKLRVKHGDIITISPCPHIKYAKRIAVFPIADTVEGLTGSLFDVFLALYFREAYRPENLSYHGH
ncbi:aspartate decarboxylase-like domain-containing protein [Trichoderma sp. SZMC 28011]